MRHYYRGPDAHVTDEYFVWLTPTPKVFPVRELRNIGLVQDRAPANRSGVALAGAAVILSFAAASFVVLGVVIGVTMTFLALIAGAVGFSARRGRSPRQWQVRATHRGVEIIVYASADVRVFNQVTRALRRSIEDDRRYRSEFGLAAA
jgi:hypothetical protein